MTNSATDTQAFLPPSQLRGEPDGSTREEWEIPIHSAQPALPSNKPVRIAALEAMTMTEQGTLLSLVYDLLVVHWRQVRFGPCIQGSVFELQADEPPTTFSYLDGYLTMHIGSGDSHFHLCLGSTRGLKDETPPEWAAARPCRAARFVRLIGRDGRPRSWQVELENGAGQQMVTFFLPSPYLDDRLKLLKEADFSRLALWDELRSRYLGERAPQPLPPRQR